MWINRILFLNHILKTTGLKKSLSAFRFQLPLSRSRNTVLFVPSHQTGSVRPPFGPPISSSEGRAVLGFSPPVFGVLEEVDSALPVLLSADFVIAIPCVLVCCT